MFSDLKIAQSMNLKRTKETVIMKNVIDESEKVELSKKLKKTYLVLCRTNQLIYRVPTLVV